MDWAIIAAVRNWLKLPGDLPIEAFYANIEDGGLQLPNLRFGLPIAKVARLQRMDQEIDHGRADKAGAKNCFKNDEV